MIVPGNAFLIPSGKEGNHIFFVALSGIHLPEYGASPCIVLVGATTLYDNAPFDDACIIEALEHPFIRHKSYMSYRHMRLEPLPHVESLAWKSWVKQEDCSTALLARIVAGISKSRFTPRYIKAAQVGQNVNG